MSPRARDAGCPGACARSFADREAQAQVRKGGGPIHPGDTAQRGFTAACACSSRTAGGAELAGWCARRLRSRRLLSLCQPQEGRKPHCCLRLRHARTTRTSKPAPRRSASSDASNTRCQLAQSLGTSPPAASDTGPLAAVSTAALALLTASSSPDARPHRPDVAFPTRSLRRDALTLLLLLPPFPEGDSAELPEAAAQQRRRHPAPLLLLATRRRGQGGGTAACSPTAGLHQVLDIVFPKRADSFSRAATWTLAPSRSRTFAATPMMRGRAVPRLLAARCGLYVAGQTPRSLQQVASGRACAAEPHRVASPSLQHRGFAAGGAEPQQQPAGDSSHPQTPPPQESESKRPPLAQRPAHTLSLPHTPLSRRLQANVVRLQPPFGVLSTLWWQLRCAPFVVDAVAWTIRNAFDKSFNLQAVLDGASDAFAYVHELLAAGDISPLQELTSPPVFDAFNATLQSYRDAGQRLVSIRVTELRSVALLSAAFRRGSDLGILDEEESSWAGLPEQPHTSHGRPVLSASEGTLYLTVRVRIDSTEVVELAMPSPLGGDGAPSAEGRGETRHTIENSRGHIWRFARCLPRALPADELNTKWRLVGVE